MASGTCGEEEKRRPPPKLVERLMVWRRHPDSNRGTSSHVRRLPAGPGGPHEERPGREVTGRVRGTLGLNCRPKDSPRVPEPVTSWR